MLLWSMIYCSKMTIEESISLSIKKVIHNVYFKNVNYLKRFLETNILITLPRFDIEEIDDSHSHIIMYFTNKKVICVITWRSTTSNNDDGRVVCNLELLS